jgi:hypothetical protein
MAKKSIGFQLPAKQQNIKPYHKDNNKLFNYLKDIGTVLSSCRKI